jgi:hypothetical protein
MRRDTSLLVSGASTLYSLAKLQHWRGFQRLFGLKAAPVLEFRCDLRRTESMLQQPALQPLDLLQRLQFHLQIRMPTHRRQTR